MRCPKCGSSSYDSDYKCLVCGHLMSSPSINHVGLNDVQPLGADSGKRDEGETKPPPPNESDYNPLLGLLTCPQCSQRALFWNRHDQIYKCVNPKCKQSFTIEEYKNREVQLPSKERQSEQIPSDVSTDKAKERMKRATKAGKHKQAMKLGTTELILSSVLTIEAKEKTPELGVPEQIPSSVSTIETNEKTPELAITEQVLSSVSTTETTEKTPELGVPEQIPSDVSTIEAKERTPELGITQQIPSDVSTIEAKERTPELGITRQIPSSGSSIEGKGGEKHGIKAGKLMNRNLAFLLISVLAIGIVILGVLQGQKSGNLDELSSELDNSRQTITELQTQLTVSQQDVKGLTDQLTQAQQKIEELQGEINALQTPLTPSEPFVYSGEMLGGDQISIPIELKQFERVEGKITGGLNGLAVYVKDAGGTIVKDFGRILQSNIMFTAQTSGIFKFVIKEPSGLPSKYNFQYTIYQFQ